MIQREHMGRKFPSLTPYLSPQRAAGTSVEAFRTSVTRRIGITLPILALQSNLELVLTLRLRILHLQHAFAAVTALIEDLEALSRGPRRPEVAES